MEAQLRRLLLWAEVNFFGFMIVCIILRPESLKLNSGISYFGNYKETLLPYAGALVITAYFLYQIVSRLPAGKLFPDWVLRFLGVIPLLMMALLLVPSNGGTLIDWTHRSFGTAIFSIQLIVSYFWWLKTKKDVFVQSLLLIEVLSGIASAIYVPLPAGFLLQSQLIYQAAFMAIFGRILKMNFGSGS